eukprot:scaffold7081_cov225-Pinguiococcus_pyrenoidosus.AAC.3
MAVQTTALSALLRWQDQQRFGPWQVARTASPSADDPGSSRKGTLFLRKASDMSLILRERDPREAPRSSDDSCRAR